MLVTDLYLHYTSLCWWPFCGCWIFTYNFQWRSICQLKPITCILNNWKKWNKWPGSRQHFQWPGSRQHFQWPESRHQFSRPESRHQFQKPGSRHQFQWPGSRHHFSRPESRHQFNGQGAVNIFNGQGAVINFNGWFIIWTTTSGYNKNGKKLNHFSNFSIKTEIPEQKWWFGGLENMVVWRNTVKNSTNGHNSSF